MAKYKRESLLRKPHEKVAAYTYFSSAMILLVASEIAFIVPSIAYGGAVFFIYRGLRRWVQGNKVDKYQKGIRNLPLYKMKSEDLKISYKNQYLGKGFKWGTKHAQRLYDLELSHNEHYEAMTKGYQWARRFVHKYERTKKVAWFVCFLNSNSRFNPWPPLPDLEGRPALHSVGMVEGEREILQPLSTRVGHTLVQGTTRVGKTRLAELLITQDIHRGDVVIVFDPKGDADLLLRMYSEAKKAGRIDDFHFFHLGFPKQSARYNPIGSFLRMTEAAGRIANQMPGEGQSAAFREFVWCWVNMMVKAIVALGKKPNYGELKRYAQNIDPLFIEFMSSLFEKHLGQNYQIEIDKYKKALTMKAEDRRAVGYDFKIPRSMQERSDFGKAHYLLFLEKEEMLNQKLTAKEQDTALSLMKGYQTDSSYMAKLTASLDPFLEKMTTGDVADLIAPDYEDMDVDVFSWNQIIQSGGIVYVGLDALSDPEVAATVGNSMFSDLTSVAGRLYKHGRDQGLIDIGKSKNKEPAICLHADEFNELAGKEFIPMLNKAGGAGIQVTAYTQTASDIEARLGSKPQAQQMEGNFNTLIMLRVLNEATARLITEKQTTVHVSHLSEFSSAADNADIDSDIHFTSSTQTRDVQKEVDLIRVNDLSKLPKGQAFALLDGNNLYKIRIPWLQQGEERLPADMEEVSTSMASRYATSNNKWYQFNEYFLPEKVINDGLSHDGYTQFTADLKETSLGNSYVE